MLIKRQGFWGQHEREQEVGNTEAVLPLGELEFLLDTEGDLT